MRYISSKGINHTAEIVPGHLKKVKIKDYVIKEMAYLNELMMIRMSRIIGIG